MREISQLVHDLERIKDSGKDKELLTRREATFRIKDIREGALGTIRII